RLVAGGDEVLEMKIHGTDGIKNCQEPAQATVVAPNLLLGMAPGGRDELHPAVIAAVQHLEGAKGRVIPALVEPAQELLEVNVDRHGPRLVDDLLLRFEPGDDHRPPPSMGVPRAPLRLHETTWVRVGEQSLPQARP